MYVCDDCGKVFSAEQAKTMPGDSGECRGTPFQFPGYIVCPACDSEEFAIGHRCRMCGDYHSEAYYAQQSALGNGDLGVCKDCRSNVLKKFAEWKADLTEPMKDVLSDAFGENDPF